MNLGSFFLHSAKPRFLPLGKLSDCRVQFLKQFCFTGYFPLQKLAHKTIFQPKPLQPLKAKTVLFVQVSHLINHTRVQPLPKPTGDVRSQFGALQSRADNERLHKRARRQGFSVFGALIAFHKLGDFNRTNHALTD